jgi:hypothetical protein
MKLNRIIVLFAVVLSVFTVFSSLQVVNAADREFSCADGTVVKADESFTLETACAGHMTPLGSGGSGQNNPATPADGKCENASFFGLPVWYKYLKKVNYDDIELGTRSCHPELQSSWDVLLILAAVVEGLLRIGVVIAVAYIIWGGVTYITSQGEPDKTKQALKMIISALIGITISIVSTAVVSFIAGRFVTT